MKHFSFILYLIYVGILLYIPSDFFSKNKIRGREEYKRHYRYEMVKPDTLDSYGRKMRNSEYEDRVFIYEIESQRLKRDLLKDEIESNELQTAFYFYGSYCFIIISMFLFISYQSYFNKQSILEFIFPVQLIYYFLNMLFDAILFNETVDYMNASYRDMDISIIYFLLAGGLIVKHLSFINSYYGISFIERNKYLITKLIWGINILELWLIFYYEWSRPVYWSFG